MLNEAEKTNQDKFLDNVAAQMEETAQFLEWISAVLPILIAQAWLAGYWASKAPGGR